MRHFPMSFSSLIYNTIMALQFQPLANPSKTHTILNWLFLPCFFLTLSLQATPCTSLERFLNQFPSYPLTSQINVLFPNHGFTFFLVGTLLSVPPHACAHIMCVHTCSCACMYVGDNFRNHILDSIHVYWDSLSVTWHGPSTAKLVSSRSWVPA